MATSISEIKKNGIYGFRGEITIYGFALVVLEIGDTLKGVRLLNGGNENFSMPKEEFLSYMDTNRLHFIEILPRFVIDTLQDGYANNLNQPSSRRILLDGSSNLS